MQTQNVSIVSVHPDPAQPLAFDLKDLLAALTPYLGRWIWCLRNLDWLGQDGEVLCKKVEAAGPAGFWIPSQDLLKQAGKIYQTIEGEFLAFPSGVDVRTIDAAELSLRSFPWNRAEIAIVAVDGGFFEVFAKDPVRLTALRCFKDVRDEDPSGYF